jgi:copper resistance protein B
MHITNLFVKSLLSSALTLSSLSVFAAASGEHTGHNEHQHHSGHHAMQNMTDDHAQHTETVDAAS